VDPGGSGARRGSTAATATIGLVTDAVGPVEAPGPATDPPVLEPRDGVGTPDRFARLWTPHRLAYITSATDDEGCPFCRIPRLPDGEGLVVARDEAVYAVLNLHPYNPGHLMVVPYRHVAGLEELDAAEAAGLMSVTRIALRALRAVAAPHAFNVGINLGTVAGGSLADHLHQHVVPRWGGDANFIAVVGQTKVIPQLLSETRDLLADAWADAARAEARSAGASRAGGPEAGPGTRFTAPEPSAEHAEPRR
jgi:ATP adenylyltransferase